MDAVPTTDFRAARRRVAPGLVLVLALLFGSSVAGGGSASAQAAPSAPTPEFPYPHDGCTLVPDAPSGVSFTAACNHHDGCYGARQLSRAACDAIFHREMVAACEASRSTRYYTCRSFASVYYVGVRVFGRPFYDSADPAVRISTPMRG
jgi:hypothetical protein